MILKKLQRRQRTLVCIFLWGYSAIDWFEWMVSPNHWDSHLQACRLLLNFLPVKIGHHMKPPIVLSICSNASQATDVRPGSPTLWRDSSHPDGWTLLRSDKPPMTGNGKNTTYKNGETGGWLMTLFYPNWTGIHHYWPLSTTSFHHYYQPRLSTTIINHDY